MALSTSYDCGSREQPLITQTLGDFFDAMAAQHGPREALVSCHQQRRLSWAELAREVDTLASAMLRSGLARGDRVGIWAHNCVEWVLMQLATAKVGVILVNINPAYRVAEVEYALN
ncbi:MAG: AMP-binding protein, partial [Betaproteobacteria bacterium]|nr:AMP-binding protein [Betaproteobacteria bacterium]